LELAIGKGKSRTKRNLKHAYEDEEEEERQHKSFTETIRTEIPFLDQPEMMIFLVLLLLLFEHIKPMIVSERYEPAKAFPASGAYVDFLSSFFWHLNDLQHEI